MQSIAKYRKGMPLAVGEVTFELVLQNGSQTHLLKVQISNDLYFLKLFDVTKCLPYFHTILCTLFEGVSTHLLNQLFKHLVGDGIVRH